jgi:hypothetical protein
MSWVGEKIKQVECLMWSIHYYIISSNADLK